MTKMTKQDKNIKNFPNLRFPGFHEEWEVKKLGDITTWSSGGTPPKDNSLFWDGDIPWISATSMRGNVYADSELKITEEGLKKGSKLAEKGTLLILVRGSMLFNKIPIGIVAKDVAFNQDVKSIVVNDYSTSEYILNWFTAFESKILNMVTGTGIGAGKLDLPDLKALEIKIPPLPEQIKLANFLFKIDQRISTQKKIIENLKLQKNSIVKRLFEDKIKFQNKDYQNWEKKKLADVSTEHLHKNPDNQYPEVFSVSKHKGVINQIEHLGRSFSAKEITHYKLVRPGDLVYTKSPTSEFPFGIIKQNRTGRSGVVSPLYCVFTPQTFELGYLIHEYFISPINTFNYLNPLVQKGAKNTMNINNDVFLNGAKLLLPMHKTEQEKIYSILSLIQEKIKIENNLLSQYELQKRYLLSNLFV